MEMRKLVGMLCVTVSITACNSTNGYSNLGAVTGSQIGQQSTANTNFSSPGYYQPGYFQAPGYYRPNYTQQPGYYQQQGYYNNL